MIKKYVKPETNVVEIKTQTFFAASPDGTNAIDTSDSEEINANDAGSRGYSDWDE